MWDLLKQDSVALVTGASRGIGRAIAIELARNGATVIVNYAKNDSSAHEVCDVITGFGGKASVFKADIAAVSDVDSMFTTIHKEFGKLDILVNNAGITDDGHIMQMSPDKFKRVIETNLYGCFYVAKKALYFMTSKKQNGGAIVNISSTSGISGNTGQGNYSASKGGIVAFSKVLAKEYADRGVRCNVVAPGFIETDMVSSLNTEIRNKYLDLIPLHRFGTPEEVADVVCYLVSQKSSYITGQTFTVDGGLLP